MEDALVQTGLAADILQWIRVNGLADGDSGWTGYTYQMPPDNLDESGAPLPPPEGDQCVVVSAYGGAMPSPSTGPGRTGVEEPSVQIRVRGTAEDVDGALAQITAIFHALCPTDGPAPLGEIYCWIVALQSDAMFLGMDAQRRRPEFSWNFSVGRFR